MAFPSQVSIKFKQHFWTKFNEILNFFWKFSQNKLENFHSSEDSGHFYHFFFVKLSKILEMCYENLQKIFGQKSDEPFFGFSYKFRTRNRQNDLQKPALGPLLPEFRDSTTFDDLFYVRIRNKMKIVHGKYICSATKTCMLMHLSRNRVYESHAVGLRYVSVYFVDGEYLIALEMYLQCAHFMLFLLMP